MAANPTRFVKAMLVVALATHVNVEAAELLVERVTVLSPQASRPQTDQYVLVKDERIAYVGSQSPVVSVGVQRIDGNGKFLTPGLMDSHVHVSSIPGMEMASDPKTASLREAFVRQQPRSYLYFGVTQLVDLSNVPEAIASFNAQPIRPDLYRCGQAPVLNGYPAAFAPQPERYVIMPNYIVEPANADSLPAGADPKAHTPEAVVESVAKSGALCIKIFVEDGFGAASDWPLLRTATIDRVRNAAQARGLLVIAHANALDMQRLALEGRVDVFAHGLWNWTNVSDAGGVPEPIGGHLRNVHAQKIGWQPTLRVISGLRDLFVPGTLDDPVYAKVVPSALLAWYRTDDGQAYKRTLKKDFGDTTPDAIVARTFNQIGDRGARATKYLFDLGHPMLLASDTPSSPTYGNQPGYDTYREMVALAEAGISLQAIFAAATINNAKQFRIERDYGTVQVGKVANLLLLDANPLLSVDAWSEIDKVILRGRVIDRESLAADRPH
jgi:imidazolonepropionase-like amidohydrolase